MKKVSKVEKQKAPLKADIAKPIATHVLLPVGVLHAGIRLLTDLPTTGELGGLQMATLQEFRKATKNGITVENGAPPETKIQPKK